MWALKTIWHSDMCGHTRADRGKLKSHLDMLLGRQLFVARFF